jgi:hypothetical protein
MRIRNITTHEGRFLNSEDMRYALMDDEFILCCAAVMKAGNDVGDPPLEVIRRTIGCAIMTMEGRMKFERKS